MCLGVKNMHNGGKIGALFRGDGGGELLIGLESQKKILNYYCSLYLGQKLIKNYLETYYLMDQTMHMKYLKDFTKPPPLVSQKKKLFLQVVYNRY
jgi:hypothetical protein